jgi:hypothetical protein
MRSRLHDMRWLVVSCVLAAATPRAFAGQAWEIEVHGGGLITTNPTHGTIEMPPPSSSVPISPLQPSFTIEPVPSWFFGDGAALLNGALPARLGAGIVSLEPVLTSRFVERRSGGSVGIRFGRSLSRRFSAEFSLDRASGELAVLQHDIDRITASEASFLSTWNALLGLGPTIGGQTVDADLRADEKRGSQLITTGTMLINVFSSGTVHPYFAVGAGYIGARDHAPSVTLTGNYRFVFPVTPQIPSVIPIQVDQTDAVTIRSTAKNAVTGVLGGGLKYALSKRWGVRVDVRDHINRDVIRTTVTAVPASASSGAGTLTLGFSSGQFLVFSTSRGVPSTLSASVHDFQTFGGTAIVNQVNVSAGLFWRF